MKTYCVQAVLWIHWSPRSGGGIYWLRKWNLSLEDPIPTLWAVQPRKYHLASLNRRGLVYNVGITMGPTSWGGCMKQDWNSGLPSPTASGSPRAMPPLGAPAGTAYLPHPLPPLAQVHGFVAE